MRQTDGSFARFFTLVSLTNEGGLAKGGGAGRSTSLCHMPRPVVSKVSVSRELSFSEIFAKRKVEELT